MVIKARDHVDSFNTAADGAILNKVILKEFSKHQNVEISFEGISELPSSFVNASIVSLLDTMALNEITSRLKIVSINRQIADMIRRCLSNGVAKIERERRSSL